MRNHPRTQRADRAPATVRLRRRRLARAVRPGLSRELHDRVVRTCQRATRQHASAIEVRNRAAAALTQHAGWSNRQAAELAGAAMRDIYPHQASAPKSEADPELVAKLAAEVRRLAALRTALTRARDEAIRELSASMGPAKLARLAGVTDERVVQIRDAR